MTDAVITYMLLKYRTEKDYLDNTYFYDTDNSLVAVYDCYRNIVDKSRYLEVARELLLEISKVNYEKTLKNI